MKKIMLLLIAVTALHVVLPAQNFPAVNIPGSEVRKITSKNVQGQEYELHVLLPGDHKTGNKKYPVLYLMDSQWDFPLAKSLYGQHYFDGFIPELIIVGVTWGGNHPNPDSLRARDYTPTNEKRLPQSGGADQFLSFLKNELFPFIEANYKADPRERILMGCSLGGLFTMYTLFTHPDMFTGYIAASPAYGWDNEVLYKYEKQYSESNPTLPARLYMTMGEVERGLPGFEKFAKHLSDRKYKNLAIRSKVLENTGHSGTKTEGFGRGMQYVFERPELKLDQSVLNRYAGTYKISTADVAFKVENGTLVFYPNPGNRYVLFAASESDYYAKSEFLKIHFNSNTESVIRRYGRTDTGIKQ